MAKYSKENLFYNIKVDIFKLLADSRHLSNAETLNIYNSTTLFMIVTEMKPLSTIKKELKSGDRICLVSCNTCARKCETGGMKAMGDLAEKLKDEGYSVVGQTLVGMIGGNVAVVLGCDASIHALKTLYPEIKIIPALNTVGLGSWDEEGHVQLIRKFE